MRKAIYWGGALLLCMSSVLLYFPGSMGNDSLSQWYQVNGILPLSDWHPPVIVRLWSFLNLLIKGPLGLLLFQQALYWVGISLLAQHILDKHALWAKLLVLVVVGFFPVTWFAMASVWKDALMHSTLLFSVGVFLLAQKSRYKLWLLPVIWLGLVLSCGFRHNAMFAVLPLVVMMAHNLFRYLTACKKAAVVIGLFLSVLIPSKVANRIGVQQHYPYLVNQVVLWNLAGLSVETEELLVPTEAFLEQDSASVDVLKRYYNDASNNNLVFNSGIVNPKIWEDAAAGKAFFDSGLRKISEYPMEYFHMRFRSLKELSGYGRWMPYMAFIFETKYWSGDENLGIPMYHMRNPNTLVFLEENVASRLAHFGFFNVIPYLFFLVAVALLLVFRRPKGISNQRNNIYLGLVMSGLLYWLPYIFIAPSNDFRYHLWTVQMAVIILIIEGVNTLQRILKPKKQL